MTTTVKTFYLEMHSPEEIKAKDKPDEITVLEAEIKEFRFNRYLYQLVGEKWSWNDKLSLSDDDWQQYAENDNLRTWVAYVNGTIAGYYELQKQPEQNVEIVYFGLAPKFLNRGLGGYLLTHALESAWQWGKTERVWVHTCTLDHESALSNYQSRGLKIYKTEMD
ncbi:GNAT family N-acetyltransferase [Vibrio sp. WXL103]|uniref:GNAT family N-acetyltransferase n=1 Tax=unclassified Vibrio TaxID=2614977 RepID=UPI003EC61281